MSDPARAPQHTMLAIDLGTSSVKVGLVDIHGRVLGSTSEPLTLQLIGQHGAEQDPDEWWRAIATAVRRLTAQHPTAAALLAGVGVTAQWSGTVAVGADGRPLMNAVIWMDARGAPYVDAITDGPFKIAGYGAARLASWLRRTGGIPTHSGKDSLAHILFIKHERPDIYDRTRCFLEPKDYINLRLTGRLAASFDSITLHWVTDTRDITRIDYDETLLRLATVERDRLPDLAPATAVLGPLLPAVARELGIAPELPVVLGTPDLQSAALGSGALHDYAAHLYLGTSSWVTCHVPFRKTDVRHNMATLPSAVPGRYFVADEQETAGACLAFLRDALIYPDDGLGLAAPPADVYRRFDALAERIPPGSDKLLFLPWLKGERTPVENPLVRGGFFNLGLQHTRAHLIRAVLEGVAFNTRWLFGALEQFVGRRLDVLNLIGGGANSDLWAQIYADVLDRTVRQVADPLQANLRGVGMLAAVGLGFTDWEQLADEVPIRRVYRPNPALRPLYDELFAVFQALYHANKPIFDRLNHLGT